MHRREEELTSQATKTHDWFRTAEGRSVYRKIEQAPRGIRSDLAAPRIVRPFAQPVQSMANGKWYDNPADLAKSHRASGNPHGVDFVEIGNDPLPAPTAPQKTDIRQIKEDIRAAKADLDAGWRPEVAYLED